jgi:hypothetical protein
LPLARRSTRRSTKLVDTAKSIASQVLQTTVGYSPKSTVSSAVALTGNAANLVDGTIIKSGDVLTIGATGGGTPTSITFGASESLAQLNAALAANNLSASLDNANKSSSPRRTTRLRPPSAPSLIPVPAPAR